MEIPGFEIQRTIGRGGMATVYLAVQKSLGRPVVLKTVNTASAESRSFADRFVNEARIIAALRHPHIITIYDVGTTDDMLYLAMEYVDGGDLQGRIRHGLTPLEALDIVARIGSALHFAHLEGVIHRDVKPANILFRRDGTSLLSDFGIAKQLKVDNELTSTGTILGSPFYMSPEQAEGKPLDGRTDIYSLGVILYEMLTGERPYPGDSAIKVIMQHIQAPVPRLPRRLARFQPLMEKMMCKDRVGRFPDAGAMVEFVSRLRQEEAASGAARGARSPGPLHPGYVGAAANTGAMSLPMPVVVAPPGRRLWMLVGCLLAVVVGLAGFYAWIETLRTPEMIRSTHPAPPSAAGPASVAVRTATAGGASGERGGGTAAPIEADVIKALEWLARNSLREDRLTEPPADNAYYYFSRLLALDPGNEVARKGFQQIAERYVALAEKEYSHGNYKKAQAYVTLGLQVQPDNKGLLTLQNMIDNRKKSLLEQVLGFLRGDG